jgi:hypothetical protein
MIPVDSSFLQRLPAFRSQLGAMRLLSVWHFTAGGEPRSDKQADKSYLDIIPLLEIGSKANNPETPLQLHISL